MLYFIVSVKYCICLLANAYTDACDDAIQKTLLSFTGMFSFRKSQSGESSQETEALRLQITYYMKISHKL